MDPLLQFLPQSWILYTVGKQVEDADSVEENSPILRYIMPLLIINYTGYGESLNGVRSPMNILAPSVQGHWQLIPPVKSSPALKKHGHLSGSHVSEGKPGNNIHAPVFEPGCWRLTESLSHLGSNALDHTFDCRLLIFQFIGVNGNWPAKD
ncbi:MAG: hypothetical protein AAB393_04575, partial [Bacteroidota bacterium]